MWDADMEMWAVASVTNDTLALLCVWESVTGVFTHLWARRVNVVQVGCRCPSALRATGALAAASTEAGKSRLIKGCFLFCFFYINVKRKSPSAVLHRWQSHRRWLAVKKLCKFSRWPPSTKFENKEGGGSLPKQYCVIWASNSSISNCHRVGPHWNLAKETRWGKSMPIFIKANVQNVQSSRDSAEIRAILSLGLSQIVGDVTANLQEGIQI